MGKWGWIVLQRGCGRHELTYPAQNEWCERIIFVSNFELTVGGHALRYGHLLYIYCLHISYGYFAVRLCDHFIQIQSHAQAYVHRFIHTHTRTYRHCMHACIVARQYFCIGNVTLQVNDTKCAFRARCLKLGVYSCGSTH